MPPPFSQSPCVLCYRLGIPSIGTSIRTQRYGLEKLLMELVAEQALSRQTIESIRQNKSLEDFVRQQPSASGQSDHISFALEKS